MQKVNGPSRLNPGAIASTRRAMMWARIRTSPADLAAINDKDIQFVDLGIQSAIKLKRPGVVLKDEAMQAKIAAAAAEIKRSKVADNILLTIKVVAVIANVALVVIGATDEIFALDLDITPLAEAITELFSEGIDKAREARGATREESLKLREEGLAAMSTLTGLDMKKPDVAAAYRDLLVKVGRKKH